MGIYNVGSGAVTTYRELMAIGRELVPDSQVVELPAAPVPPPIYPLDISRLRDDTGFAPQCTARSALVDYLAWLGAGNAF